MSKVHIVNPNHEYTEMFRAHGWEIQPLNSYLDLVVFTGGADVSPIMYNEPAHPSTWSQSQRDAIEAGIYQDCIAAAVPMVGICRGGQFLNVMNGGRMWQDVDHHAIHGTHEAQCLISEEVVDVTSTHHQMMIPADDGQVVMYAYLSNWRTTMQNGYASTQKRGDDEPDVEAVYYEKTSCLCYQPHPEYVDGNEEHFFMMLEETLGVTA